VRNTLRIALAVCLGIGAVLSAWGMYTVMAFNPQTCGRPVKLSFIEKAAYLAQNGSSPVPCAADLTTGACTQPGNSCVDPVTGDHGKCTTQTASVGSTLPFECACVKNSPGPSKKK